MAGLDLPLDGALADVDVLCAHQQRPDDHNTVHEEGHSQDEADDATVVHMTISGQRPETFRISAGAGLPTGTLLKGACLPLGPPSTPDRNYYNRFVWPETNGFIAYFDPERHICNQISKVSIMRQRKGGAH